VAQSTDAELVERVRSGDREAYGSLVSRYQGHVYGLAYSLVDDWAEAQDIAQDAFVRAYLNLDQLQDPARFAAWLRRVVFSISMNWLKSFRPELFRRPDGQADLEALEVPDFEPGPLESLERTELAEAVRRAIDSLPARYRLPLTMFHLDGLSYERVASFLDIPLGTAKSLIHRARERLKLALAPYVREEVAPMVQEVFNEHRLPNEFPRQVMAGIVYQAGLPTAYVQALDHAGIAVDFAQFTAMTGWAFSFGYKPDDISPAFLAIRGNPRDDGPTEVFRSLTGWLGFEYESAPTEDRNKLWAFVRKHVDAGDAILSEHHDGGLICGYRQTDGKRQVYFVGPPITRWIDLDSMQPFEVCVLVKKGDSLPEKELHLNGLERAVRFGSAHTWHDVPQGLAALEAYAADVADPGKTFAKTGDWFCWAAFERLDARKCAAVWLEQAAQVLGEPELGEAATCYHLAYESYAQYRKAVGAGGPQESSIQGHVRTPAKAAQLAAILRQGIEHERAGLEAMAAALEKLGW
jgi:RNA polymerase sigma-70 factor (ECF subfamily)